MPRTRIFAVGLAVALLAGACQGGEDSDPAERGDEAGSAASETSEAEPLQDAPSGASTTPGDEPQETAQPAADAAPVRLGERFAWCSTVQALWDAQDEARAETEAAAVAHEAAVRVYEAATDELDRAEAGEAADSAFADYAFAARGYGQIRWHAAGLIFSDESSPLGRGLEDATLQVALERAFEAYRSIAAADTVAAFDLAHEATENAMHLYAVAYSDSDEPAPPVEAPESESVAFDASEAWLRATEALQDTIKRAETAERAKDEAAAATAASRAAKTEAEDAAWAIYSAAQDDGDWEALIRDAHTNMAVALSGAEAVEGFATQALKAAAVATEAARAARAAARASSAAVAVAEQSGATEGADAYADAYSDMGAPPGIVVFGADISARLADAIAAPASHVVRAAEAVEDAAWYVARISADLDSNGVTAFKESLQESCQ